MNNKTNKLDWGAIVVNAVGLTTGWGVSDALFHDSPVWRYVAMFVLAVVADVVLLNIYHAIKDRIKKQ